ncbi:putative Histidine kinase [uncultured Desulfatiglans sp.]|nr:putative Histidine kinase [uncultured Desulfatiglans sp.]
MGFSNDFGRAQKSFDMQPMDHKTNKVRRVVRQIENLPAFPTLVTKLLEIFDRDEIDLEEVADLITTDAAVAMKVISLVNSVYHGLRAPVTSVRNAVVLLGLDEIRHLTMTLLVFQSLRYTFAGDSNEVDHQLWLHSLGCAVAAEILADKTAPSLKTEAFLGGLLHDIGRMVFHAFFRTDWEQILNSQVPGESLLEMEEDLFGCDHTLAGKWLAEKWRLPEIMVHVIWLHHRALDTMKDLTFIRNQRLMHIIQLADLLSHDCMADTLPPIRGPEERKSLFQILGIPENSYAAILDVIGRQISRRATLLEIHRDEKDFYLACLKAARRTLDRMISGSQSLRRQKEERRLLEGILSLQQLLLEADDIHTFLLTTADHVRESMEIETGLVCCRDAGDNVDLEGACWLDGASARLFEFPLHYQGATEDSGYHHPLQEMESLIDKRGQPGNPAGRGSTKMPWFEFQDPYFILPFRPEGTMTGELALRLTDKTQLAVLSGMRYVFDHLKAVMEGTLRRIALLEKARAGAESLSLALARNERFIHALKISTDRFESLFQHSDDAIILHDPQGRMLRCNQRARIVLSLDEKMPDEEAPLIQELFEKHPSEAGLKLKEALALPDGKTHEIKLKRPDGGSLYATLSSLPLGQDTHLRQSVIRDISAEKNALSALETEKERLAVTLRSIGDGVIAADEGGRVVLLNKVAEDITGFSQDEAAGKPIDHVFKLLDTSSRQTKKGLVDEVIRSGQIKDFDASTILMDRNNEERLIWDSIAPIIDRQGKILGAVVVFRDITEKTRMEEEIGKAQKYESLALLSGGIAHDFNNILTAISGQISLAKMYLQPEEKAYEKLVQAEKASFRAKDLTQQLLTFSRRGYVPIKQPSSIKAIILDSVCFALRGSNVTHDCQIPDDLKPVNCDPGQINQVLNNLIINAEQSMPNGGVIRIQACNIFVSGSFHPLLSAGKYVQISIRDQGAGIPRENLCRIFDPYFSTKAGGSGLGLATSYAIIKKHNGHIVVESTPGEGSVFTLYLPAAGKEGWEPPSLHDQDGEEQRELKGKGRILIMDNEAELLDVLQEAFESMGYTVVCASDGETALQTYRAANEAGKTFDITILDLTVPGGMGAKETLDGLRAINPAAIAIVASGYANHPLIVNYREFGFNAAIGKPYRITELHRLLVNLLKAEPEGVLAP